MKNLEEFGSNGVSQPKGRKAELGVSVGSPLLDLEGVSLAWEEYGEGVPVVCLHSVGHGADDFRMVREQSPAGCRLLLFDWPGHGRSPDDGAAFTVERCVDLLAGFMDARQLRDAILLGSEFGATVALAFAMRHRARARGLVLIQPAGLLQPIVPRRPAELNTPLRRAIRRSLRMPCQTAAELNEQRIVSLEAEHAAQISQAARSLHALEKSLRAGLTQISCPLLIAQAARSRAYPIGPFQDHLASLLGAPLFDDASRAKLAIFAGSLSPLWESPVRLARVLSGFANATLPMDRHRHSWTLAATDWPARGMNQWLCTHPGCRAEHALPIGENPDISGAGD